MPNANPNAAGSARDDPYRLSFGGKSNPESNPKPNRYPPRRVICQHLQATLYSHWLPNDPRGSNSIEIRKESLEELGPILPGRQPIQPPREELKEFYREANPLLEHKPFWIDDAKRQALADAFAQVIVGLYTVWACAICSNHVHFLIRAHRDTAEQMWLRLTDAGREALQRFPDVGPNHPVWSSAPWTTFLFTPADVWDRIGYVERNPMKEGLPPQRWPFVQPYNNWPLHRRKH